MNEKSTNIHPFSHLLPRESKEELLRQQGKVLWLTGLSGSGKSTIAKGLEEALHDKGFFSVVLDGDNVRTGINKNLSFSEDDRRENIRRIAEVAKLFVANGVVTICSFVSPTEELRALARKVIGKDDFLQVFINTPIEECEKRDVKGLYAKARKGEIKDFTGINAPFENPTDPDLEIKTSNKSAEESVKELLEFVLPQIRNPKSEIRN
jgi:adenylylsulfate kinase